METAAPEDDTAIRLAIATPSENIQGLARSLTVVDAYYEIGTGFGGKIHTAARSALRGCCSGCVVPSGIFKAMQVAAALALPAEARIELARAEEEER